MATGSPISSPSASAASRSRSPPAPGTLRSPPPSLLIGAGAAAGGWLSNDLFPRQLADVNGDKLADIVAFGFGGVQVALATGAGHFAEPTTELARFGAGAAAGGWLSDDLFPRELADVNGDGLSGYRRLRLRWRPGRARHRRRALCGAHHRAC